MKKILSLAALMLLLSALSATAIPISFHNLAAPSAKYPVVGQVSLTQDLSSDHGKYFLTSNSGTRTERPNISNDQSPTATTNAVPEPTSLVLIGLGALGLGLYRKLSR